MKHYEALGLTNTASAADIRSAYRRLVLLTHPDRTPDPMAHARYLDINAAYEVLSDPARRAAYDNSFRAPRAIPVSPGRTRDAARRTARAQHSKRGAVPLTTKYAAEYAFSLRLAKPLMLLALLLAFSFAGDYVLASRRAEQVLEVETIVYYTGTKGLRQSHHYYRHKTAFGVFDASQNVPPGTTLFITRTPVWRIATTVSYGKYAVEFEPVYSIANGLLLLFMTGAAWVALRPAVNADQRLTAAMLAAAMLCVVLFRMVL